MRMCEGGAEGGEACTCSAREEIPTNGGATKTHTSSLSRLLLLPLPANADTRVAGLTGWIVGDRTRPSLVAALAKGAMHPLRPADSRFFFFSVLTAAAALPLVGTEIVGYTQPGF